MKLLAVIVLMLSVSAPVNAFLVTDFDGGRINVKDHMIEGQWTLIMLWQLDCVPCEEHKPYIEAFHEKYTDTKASVVGLVIDGHDYMPLIKKFVAKKPTRFPSLVVFSDVFQQQITEETGKPFHFAPGYILYTPNGEIKAAINHRVDIEQLMPYLEAQVGSE